MGNVSTAERYFLVCKLRKILDIALLGVGCDSSDAIASWRWYWFVGCGCFPAIDDRDGCEVARGLGRKVIHPIKNSGSSGTSSSKSLPFHTAAQLLSRDALP